MGFWVLQSAVFRCGFPVAGGEAPSGGILLSMAIDSERFLRLVWSIRGSLSLLGELRNCPKSGFLAVLHKQCQGQLHRRSRGGQGYRQPSHLLQNRLRPLPDYGDAFQVLAKADTIDATFSEELGQMARLRNRRIAELLKEDGPTKKYGSGIQRIRPELVRCRRSLAGGLTIALQSSAA